MRPRRVQTQQSRLLDLGWPSTGCESVNSVGKLFEPLLASDAERFAPPLFSPVSSTDPNGGGFPTEPCWHAHPFSTSCSARVHKRFQSVSLRAPNKHLSTRCRNRSRQACTTPQGGAARVRVLQMLQSGATRVCDPAQRGSAIPASDCTRTDDVRRLLNTSRRSRWETQQTRKRESQSPLPLFALSAAKCHLQHQAVKTILLKRFRHDVRPVQERIHNSQTELVLSQSFLHPQLLDAEVSSLPRT